jgi:hypothetical protein
VHYGRIVVEERHTRRGRDDRVEIGRGTICRVRAIVRGPVSDSRRTRAEIFAASLLRP